MMSQIFFITFADLPCAPQMDLVPIDAPAGFNGLLVFVSRPFRCSGRLTSIKFRAVAEGDFVLSIWRKVIDSSLTISMVHKVQIGFHSQEGSDPLIIPGEGVRNGEMKETMLSHIVAF